MFPLGARRHPRVGTDDAPQCSGLPAGRCGAYLANSRREADAAKGGLGAWQRAAEGLWPFRQNPMQEEFFRKKRGLSTQGGAPSSPYQSPCK